MWIIADRYHFQPSELWEMEAKEFMFWWQGHEELNRMES
jgi:hypothetical protein